MTEFHSTSNLIDIAIIGAGIGGAAAAVALQHAGFEVEMFEQAYQLREIGGAIVIREPSMVLLAQWGVLGQLRPKMVAVNKVEIHNGKGNVLGTVPTAIEAGESELSYCVHRADIHGALISQVRPGRLYLGHRLASVQNFPSYAEARFDNGVCIRAHLIIGADGLHSIVRTLVDATPMTFLNKVVHRTIVPGSLLPANMPNDRIRMWQSGDLVMNLIPIRNGSEIAISAAIPAEAPPEKLWSATTTDEISSLYADFDPLLTRLIKGRCTEITTHPIYDKVPIAKWAEGHIVLLGDAAHPMAPMNGQGANQAIQDGGVLATVLSARQRDDLAAALAEYQSVRAPVTARIQTQSRQPPPSLKSFGVSRETDGTPAI
jgi:salicylate hydroxylase